MNNPPRDEDINDHDCVKAISEMLDINEEDKSRISLQGARASGVRTNNRNQQFLLVTFWIE